MSLSTVTVTPFARVSLPPVEEDLLRLLTLVSGSAVAVGQPPFCTTLVTGDSLVNLTGAVNVTSLGDYCVLTYTDVVADTSLYNGGGGGTELVTATAAVPARTIYASAAGGGSGLIAGSRCTLQEAVSSLVSGGIFASGVIIDMSAGTYPAPSWPRRLFAFDYITLQGPDPGTTYESLVGYAISGASLPDGSAAIATGFQIIQFPIPNEPTAIIDAAAGGATDRGIKAYDGTMLQVKHVETVGFSTAGVDCDAHARIVLYNHWDRRSARGRYFKRCRYSAAGGQLLDNTIYGVSELFGVTRDYTYAETMAADLGVDVSSTTSHRNNAIPYGTRIARAARYGFHAKEHSHGHADYLTLEDCPNAFSLLSQAVANVGNMVIRSGNAIRGQFTTLTAAITSGTATLNVVTTTNVAATGTVWIDDEQVSYTGKTTLTLTGLTRGVNGSSAAAHASGARVILPAIATEVTGSVAAGSTSLEVVSTQGFPATGSVFIEDERIDYTDRSARSISGLTRGAGGTTAAAHASGSLVRAVSQTTLNGAIGDAVASTVRSSESAADTTFGLVDSTGFAASGTVAVDYERIAFTGNAANDLTGCTRGSNDTTAMAHKVGATVRQVESIVVTDASYLPASGAVRVGSEVITYISKAGNTLQGCRRAANATTSAAHASGDTVTLVGRIDIGVTVIDGEVHEESGVEWNYGVAAWPLLHRIPVRTLELQAGGVLDDFWTGDLVDGGGYSSREGHRPLRTVWSRYKDQQHTGDTAEYQVAAWTIPAKRMNVTGKQAKVILCGSIAQGSSGTGMSFVFRLGGTSLLTLNAGTSAAAAGFRCELTVTSRADGDSDQYVEGSLLVDGVLVDARNTVTAIDMLTAHSLAAYSKGSVIANDCTTELAQVWF